MSDVPTPAKLLEPLSVEAPCGKSLENTLLLVELDRAEVFGHRAAYRPPRPDAASLDERKGNLPDWSAVQASASEALTESKDLRALAHLAVARLWLEGMAAFLELLPVAADWLENHWDGAYPRVEDEAGQLDAFSRQNALGAFADPMAVLYQLRRAPVVVSRAHGSFALGDLEPLLASDPAAPLGAEGAQLAAALADASVEHLQGFHSTIAAGIEALRRVEKAMRERAGSEWVPDYRGLLLPLTKLRGFLEARVRERTGEPAPSDAGLVVGPSTGGGALGSVRSRQDALRALDAVAAFFRESEPTSPVPLFVDRVKRLVSARDFLEVLADVVPGAVDQARQASGLPPVQ